MRKGITKSFFIAAIACLTLVSGTRAQEYEWHITYPPIDSGQYDYMIHAVDCWGEVCTAVATRLLYGSHDMFEDICIRSTDGGSTWIEQYTGIPPEMSENHSLRVIQQIDSLNAVAIGDSGLVVKTTDGGNTWLRQNLNSTGQVYFVNFSDTLTGIAVKGWGTNPGDSSNIMITHDGGGTWVPSPFCPWLGASMCHADGGESFRAIGDAEGPVYITHDDWITIDSTSLIIPLTDSVHVIGYCNFIGTDTLVGYGANWVDHSYPLMYITQSTDGGVTWISPNVPDTLISDAQTMSSLDRDIIFYGGSSENRIAVSRDHGMSWEIDPYIFDTDSRLVGATLSIRSVAVTQSNEGVGIFSNSPILTNASVIAQGVPVSAGVVALSPVEEMLEIFPNPASNTISFTNSSGTLNLTDPLGRNYVIKQTGNTLDISSLPSGVYFISDGVSRAKFVKE